MTANQCTQCQDVLHAWVAEQPSGDVWIPADYRDTKPHSYCERFSILLQAPHWRWRNTITGQIETSDSYAQPIQPQPDPIAHPAHYTAHPSGVECIQITEHMNFCIGNAMKYLWRAGLKDDAVVDLKKAVWYIEREIERRMK